MVAMLWLFHDRTATKIVSEVGSKFLKKKNHFRQNIYQMFQNCLFPTDVK